MLAGVGGLIALAILFLGVVMLSNATLRGMRLDLTQNKLYTLTPGTRQVLADLKEPVNLYFYFSRDAATKQSPLILPYAARVREFLEEIAARSGGNVHVRVVDPQPFSDDEDRAAEFGLQSLQSGSGDALYFGLAGTNSTLVSSTSSLNPSVDIYARLFTNGTAVGNEFLVNTDNTPCANPVVAAGTSIVALLELSRREASVDRSPSASARTSSTVSCSKPWSPSRLPSTRSTFHAGRVSPSGLTTP